ncbi:MAG: hypothetical protein ACJ763_12960 [Bdellovibrionia bacterium]
MSCRKICATLIAVVITLGFSLMDASVGASVSCVYNVGGCGFPIAYDLEEYVQNVADGTACAALCGGRLTCAPLTPMSPWGCTY